MVLPVVVVLLVVGVVWSVASSLAVCSVLGWHRSVVRGLLVVAALVLLVVVVWVVVLVRLRSVWMGRLRALLVWLVMAALVWLVMVIGVRSVALLAPAVLLDWSVFLVLPVVPDERAVLVVVVPVVVLVPPYCGVGV